ncbi:MAG TPA: hypothetical protein VMX54_11610 [Vicinamibacteria bacterium]|nr:hypothetical protein [Vicinamibacteria bacterium]
MVRLRAITAALAPVLFHALAREADRGLGLVLRAELPQSPAGLLREVARAVAADGPAVPLRIAAWLAAAVLAWWLLRRQAAVFAPLWLRPALTLLALAAVAVQSTWPYGFTLPVALTQDWAVGQDAAALAAILASRLPAVRLPAPRAREVFFVSFLAYAMLVPGWAWLWQGHPGNEPKYLRQAVALGHFLTFDATFVTGAMENLPTAPLAPALARGASTLVRESGRMLKAVARGEAGRDAIRASRITRQTVRGKEGGVFYVLAPGPSLLLAPALRVDRAIDRARGTPGRVAVAVLVWCAIAALLVAALFQLIRDATGRQGLAALLALGFAVLPPFLFYSFEFYPEMLGALLLAVAFRRLALDPARLVRHPWLFSWMLSALPWLHQKFLPVWLVLAATAVYVGRRRTGSAGERTRLAIAILVPQALSLYLTALYNFAITGSVRPDALFLAWGPGGVTPARIGQGLLGLLLDARYGILPYVPLLTVAAAGLAGEGRRRFAVILPAAGLYYLTVASADNWAGAVSHLGRYFMPVAPLAVALVAVAVVRETASDKPEGARRGALALVLMLAGWSALFALALWRDPLAASDSARLLARSSYADGNQYVPNLFIRHWSDAAPGLWARVAAWLVGIGALVLALRRVSSPARALAGLGAMVLVSALLLERWPSPRAAAVFTEALPAGDDTRVLCRGDAQVREDEAVLGPGTVELEVRRIAASVPGQEAPLRATVGGSGLLQVSGLPPVVLRPTGGVIDLPLSTYHVVAGGGGLAARFARVRAAVSGQAVIRFGGVGAAGRHDGVRPPAASPGEDFTTEPDVPGIR